MLSCSLCSGRVTKNLSKKAPAVVKGNGRSQQKAVTTAAAEHSVAAAFKSPRNTSAALRCGEEHLPTVTMLGNKSRCEFLNPTWTLQNEK